jgi:hypothetical protein
MPASDNVIDFQPINAGLRQAQAAADQAGDLAGGGDPPDNPPMSDERIARLEGQVQGVMHAHHGISHAQNVTLAGLGVFAAVLSILVAFGVFELGQLGQRVAAVETKVDATSTQLGQRIDAINDKLNALPGQISADLRDLSKTIAENITAARQFPQTPAPPAPQLPQTPPPRPLQDIPPR